MFDIRFDLIYLLLAVITAHLTIRFISRRPKVYYLSSDTDDQWITIDKIEEYNFYKYGEILITDGEDVRPSYGVNYNNKGEPIFRGYPVNSIITHWRPLPKPPTK